MSAVVILFVVTPPFRRNFRPRRPHDTIPVQPLIDVLLYWFCGAFGGLCGSVGLVALLGWLYVDGVSFEPVEIAIIAAMTTLAPPLLWIAWRSWHKLNHPGL